MAGLLRHLRQNIRLASSFGKSQTNGANFLKRHIASTETTDCNWRVADEYVGKMVLVTLSYSLITVVVVITRRVPNVHINGL